MKVGDKVVVTEDGKGHYLKKPSLATIINVQNAVGGILVNGKADNDGKALQQYLMPGDYEVIEEGAELD